MSELTRYQSLYNNLFATADWMQANASGPEANHPDHGDSGYFVLEEDMDALRAELLENPDEELRERAGLDD